MGVGTSGTVVWIVEKGNSRWKIGVFLDGEIVDVTNLDPGEDLCLGHLPKGQVDGVLLAGSGDWNTGVAEMLRKRTKGDVTEIKHGDPHPLKTEVENPGSLGTDRVANAFAVQSGVMKGLEQSKVWMIVDVGTCVTTDVVCDGLHLGGSISPGLSMRINAMRDGTAALPGVEKEVWAKLTPFKGETIGKTTQKAIIKGAADGISAEIIGRWGILNEQFGDEEVVGVILTGGDSSFLELGRVMPKFADSNLTLKGYYAIFSHIQLSSKT
jgi:type III pantothenate kinase